MRHKGVICGILAAVCYGTNPFGALPLYEEGVNTSSVLFYRFSMAVVMLGVMLLEERKSFRINRQELIVLGSLGLLFAASCITYYESFLLMDAGIASTIATSLVLCLLVRTSANHPLIGTDDYSRP